MTLIVQKFGGTSLGSLERIQKVAQKVAATRETTPKLVVVVSAMHGETDKLIRMAKGLVGDAPSGRELDVLLATGEQCSAALLSMALEKLGCSARSYTGFQVPIVTESVPTKARIMHIDVGAIQKDLESGYVVVVTGFQGIDPQGNITTIGRGGSDTTAVALAAALKANECQIYTDVEGVYTTDPRVVPEAQLMTTITSEEMLEMASLGAKVLQIDSVELAQRYRVPLRVLSTFVEGTGTLVTLEDDQHTPHSVVTGIAFSRDEAKLTFLGLPDRSGILGELLSAISVFNINIDMIMQKPGEHQSLDLAFTLHRNDYNHAMKVLQPLIAKFGGTELYGDDNVAKISVVGVGMRSHAGVAAKVFQILGEAGINIQCVTTSEIKISVLVEEQYVERGVQALHTEFGLNQVGIETKSYNQTERSTL